MFWSYAVPLIVLVLLILGYAVGRYIDHLTSEGNGEDE
jgi:hypothetical protein